MKIEQDEIISEVNKFIAEKKAQSPEDRHKFVFDNLSEWGIGIITTLFAKATPQFIVTLCQDWNTFQTRYNIANENEPDQEMEEETKAEQEEIQKKYLEGADKARVQYQYARSCKFIDINAADSLATTADSLKSQFQPKVIVVNHEKRLGIDVSCSNLAIKYNLIYISVYQLIGQHIQNETAWGKKLIETKRDRDINLSSQVRDEFNEAEFSPAHYNNEVVMELIRYTVR